MRRSTVGRLSADCRPTVSRLSTDTLADVSTDVSVGSDSLPSPRLLCIHVINCSCLQHIINILTELSRSEWENLDPGCVYRPPCIWALFMTSDKILLYGPPARIIRANYCFLSCFYISLLNHFLITQFCYES